MDDYLALKERFLTDQYQDHIKAVFGEDITISMTDYFQKSFSLILYKSHLSSINDSYICLRPHPRMCGRFAKRGRDGQKWAGHLLLNISECFHSST